MMLAAMLLAAPVAQPADPLADAWLVQVKPGAKLAFFDDVEGAKPKPSRAYVVAGDVLVARDTRGGFTSVTFVNPAGKTRSGWLDSARLTRIAAGTRWQGVWQAWESEIKVMPGRIGGTLHVEGSATWGGHAGHLHFVVEIGGIAQAADQQRRAFALGEVHHKAIESRAGEFGARRLGDRAAGLGQHGKPFLERKHRRLARMVQIPRQ